MDEEFDESKKTFNDGSDVKFSSNSSLKFKVTESFPTITVEVAAWTSGRKTIPRTNMNAKMMPRFVNMTAPDRISSFLLTH